MIGRNILKLNHATVVAALQMYLDSERRPEARKQVVQSVEATRGVDQGFEVEIVEKDETPICKG